MAFQMPKYHHPDFNRPELASAPDAKYEVVEKDGVAPDYFHSTSMYPEYFKINGTWVLAEESRMDSSVVLCDDGHLEVVENRNLKKGDKVILGRSEDGEEGMDEETKAALQSAAYAEADTKAERDEAVKDAGRRVEDALLPEASSSELTELSMEKEKLSDSLSVYREVLQQEGQVFSERSGVVTGVSLSAGERIGDTAVLRLSDDTVPCQLKILISREQKKHVGLKDFVTVKLEGESEFQTTVTYLGESASGDGSYEILIPLSEGEGIPGQSGTLTASDAGEKFPFCIPVYALHSENTRNYVYAVKQREGILGEESYIEEINVTVQDQNENYAAITGALDGDTMIVVSATKEIKNGGTVRQQGQVQ